MAWIALTDHSEQYFAPAGLGCDAGRAPALGKGDDALLVRGSLVMEVQVASDGKPLQLFDYKGAPPWRFRLSVQAIPEGGVVLVMGFGGDVQHAATRLERVGVGDALRVTVSWDAPLRWARLALEHVGTGRIAMSDMSNPKPLPLSELRQMMTRCGQRHMNRHVKFLAISTAIEPVGPMPTLTGHVPLATPWGLRDVAQLRRGDVVHCGDRGGVPVLHKLRRVVPARGSFRPIRLRAPYFGLRRDILVSPDQRLIIGGSEVEYMFGRERVLVPARHLVNGVSAIYAQVGTTIAYHGLILPGCEPVQAAGTPLETMFIGRIRRKPVLLKASLLAGLDRNSLPEHALSTYPVLRPFEAIMLAENRAA
ncbi:Hint domain-containing protein [Lutimaribacter sp. EGI FJ00015]|uniref:Hint domain-containing protein n=1 Tax=Lutimaribacter degradans TaxID=2945989 RepID=A0ACC5ZU13_9RHOB|nr:Hint domain-containing protein [Lutimaribacter sp. EGI FJ00013]MCM2561782.1 Hint domain-containing protein [Lutimaribacter sp. EGI FJ00013]MCO0613185.1 Hint domain-containing protein [Lutimaribacter sp. EGI FJ00015]MCO0635615.1 Hint domain-containing protein [Lutimaribacter sp. EGI FJ00014]